MTGSWQLSSSSHDTRQQNIGNDSSEDTYAAHSANEPRQSQEHDIMDYSSGSNPVLSELALKSGEHEHIDPAQSHNTDGKFPRLEKVMLPF